jgi:hypothetical protein
VTQTSHNYRDTIVSTCCDQWNKLIPSEFYFWSKLYNEMVHNRTCCNIPSIIPWQSCISHRERAQVHHVPNTVQSTNKSIIEWNVLFCRALLVPEHPLGLCGCKKRPLQLYCPYQDAGKGNMHHKNTNCL